MNNSFFSAGADKLARMQGERERFLTLTSRGDSLYIGLFSESHRNELTCEGLWIIDGALQGKSAKKEDFCTLRDMLATGKITIPSEIGLDYDGVIVGKDEDGNDVIDATMAPITEVFALAARRAALDRDVLSEMPARTKDYVANSTIIRCSV